MFQDFSLPGRPRDRSHPLAEVLAGKGTKAGSRVGVIGWKQHADPTTLQVPACVVDVLRFLVGPDGVVENTADREPAKYIDQESQEVAEDWSDTVEGDPVGAGLRSRRGVSFGTLVGSIGRLSHLEAPGRRAE